MKHKLSERLYRTLTLRAEHVNEEDRTIELAFSSEAPVERFFGVEILKHEPENVDLSFLNDGAPLLFQHDPERQIGVIEAARVDGDNVGRAIVRFSKAPFASEIFQDVQDGIRKKVSVGYMIQKYEEEEREGQAPLVNITRWKPLEVSVVSIPADVSVGVGRSAEVEEGSGELGEEAVEAGAETVESTERTIEDAQETVTPQAEVPAEPEAIVPEAETRSITLNEDKNIVTPEPTPMPENLGLNSRELKQYSVLRAIRSQMPNSPEARCFERELSDEIARKLGREPQGVFVPYDVQVAKRATDGYTAGVAIDGGNLVKTDFLASSFIDILRNNVLAFELGAQSLMGLVGSVAIPKRTKAASAYWVTENGAVTETSGSFGQVTLAPKTVGAYNDISRQLILQSDPSIERLVFDDIAQVLGIAIDAGILYGIGSSGQPTGILSASGVYSTALVTGSFANVVALETTCSVMNYRAANLAYVMSPTIWGGLKTYPKLASTDSVMVMQQAGELNGYRAFQSTQVPAGILLFGDFSQVLVGMWGSLDLTVDPYTTATTGQVRVVGLQSVDVAVRYAQAFAFGTGMVHFG